VIPLPDTQEFRFVRSLLSAAGGVRLGGAQGVGDDAVDLGGGLFASADMSVEGTHFRLDWSTPRQAVEKCLLSNLSDINAMGASASAVLLSLCLNKKWPESVKNEVAESFGVLCEKYGVRVMGGDTTAGDTGCFSVTVFGKLQEGSRPLLRSNARPGDFVFVNGHLGASARGLELLERGQAPQTEEDREAIALHLVPEPPLGVGPALATLGDPPLGACMDLSDGLASGLHTLALASQVKIRLTERLNSYELFGGEDYGLLFTFPENFDKGFRIVGRVEEGAGVFGADGAPILPAGFEHWQPA
jgi:thiamine-monophosphate kinase